MNSSRVRGALSAAALLGALRACGHCGAGRMQCWYACGLIVGELAVRGAGLRRDG